MSRKRIVVSLADDPSSRTLTQGGWQIAFALAPTELSSPYELYKTVHPIIWEIYDCSFGEPQTLEYDHILGVSTVRKEPDNSVVPVLSRVIPLGHYTALIRQHGRAEWCETKRYKDDMPSTIVITNDSNIEQSFAISLAIVEKYAHSPRFAPAVMFNRIPHGRHLHVKAEFQLRAFLGRGLKQLQQVHEQDDGKKPILDGNGDPWAMKIDDLPTMSSFRIAQLSSGSVVITVEENQASIANREILQDVGVLKEKLRDFQLHVSRALGNDYLAVQRLKTEVQKINEKAASLKADMEGSNARVDGFGKEVEDITTKVTECQEAITKLKVPTNAKSDLATRLDSVASTVKDMSKLHSSMRVMEEKMQGFGDSLQGLPRLQENVGSLAGKVQILSDDVGKMASTVGSVNRRITVVSEKVEDNDVKIATVERSVSTMRRTIDGVSGEAEQTSQSVKNLTAQLRAKANSSDLESAQTEIAATVAKMRRVEGVALGMETRLGTVEERVGNVAGTVETFQSNVKELTAKIEDVEAKQLLASSELQKGVGEVSRKVKIFEDTIQQLSVTSGKAAAVQVSDKAELKTMKERLDAIDSIAGEASSRVKRVQDDMRSIKGDTGVVKKQVLALEGNVRMVEGSARALDSTVQNLEKLVKGKSWLKW